MATKITVDRVRKMAEVALPQNATRSQIDEVEASIKKHAMASKITECQACQVSTEFTGYYIDDHRIPHYLCEPCAERIRKQLPEKVKGGDR